MPSLVKWARSRDGYVFSHCGRFVIEPHEWQDDAKLRSYELRADGVFVLHFDTQADAKERAQLLHELSLDPLPINPRELGHTRGDH